jgi:hypothetical protein
MVPVTALLACCKFLFYIRKISYMHIVLAINCPNTAQTTAPFLDEREQTMAQLTREQALLRAQAASPGLRASHASPGSSPVPGAPTGVGPTSHP